MHTTTVTLKNGEVVAGPIWTWRPEEGWFAIINECGDERRIEFADVKGATTPGQRIAVGVIADQDELARAVEDLAEGRKYGWDGYPSNQFDWETDYLKRKAQHD